MDIIKLMFNNIIGGNKCWSIEIQRHFVTALDKTGCFKQCFGEVRATLREEIFVENIFVEFVFTVLPQSRKIEFRQFCLIGTNRKSKFRKKFPFCHDIFLKSKNIL